MVKKTNKSSLFDNRVAKKVLKSVWGYVALPCLLYIVVFFLFQPHYLSNFSNGFYLDNGDGFQNVWNIWWVNESITQLGQHPYFTTMLHWPHGTSLLPQTMNIFNGLMAVPLINIFGLSIIEAVNFAVLFSFIFGGLAMFWFIQRLLGKYPVSLIAGGLFTFSSYHFAHAQGHLQLVSLEFIPLFLLAFWIMIEKMRYIWALLAAGALFLVLLCDYYYLFWCVILGALWFLWQVRARVLKLTRHNIQVLGVFALTSLLLNGPIVFKLLSLNKHDPLIGGHDSTQFALDPLSVIIPGGSWYWNTLTGWHWKQLPYLSEMSNFFGFALVAVLIIAFYKWVRKQLKAPSWLNYWWLVLFLFGILSLGPHPTLFGKTARMIPLPYLLLEKLFPTLKLSGMPVRWVLIALIAAIIIVSYLLSKLNLQNLRDKRLLLLFVAVSFIDLRPMRLPLTSPHYRPYVERLKQLPYGAVIDNGALSGAEQLYHQTIHKKPMAFGYVTRVPTSVDKKDFLIFAALEEKRFDSLCREHKIRYVTLPDERPLDTIYPVIYNDGDTIIYDLKNSDNC